MSLLRAPVELRSPPRPTPWLTRRRRPWIAWVALTLPLALWSSDRLHQPAESARLGDAAEAARRAAYARAFERITGERLDAPVSTAPGTAGSGLLPAAVEANIQRYLEILANPDGPLRADLERIERDFRPKLDRAASAERRSYWTAAASVWVALGLAGYAAGVTVFWMRRRAVQ